jgi:predicted Zn-dependent peptidase
MLERLPRCKSVGIAVGFPAGGRTEKAEVSGISHYLEHMIFKGTATVRNVDAAFQRVGANINAVTEVDSTVYIAECPKENGVKALGLWLQFLSEASIDSAEFERERGVILSEYFISEDNPDYLVEKNITLTLFRGHPLSTTVIGSEDTIKAISHRDMLSYFRRWYHPSQAVIWVSGDLKMDTLISCIERQDDWTKQGAAPTLSYETFKPKRPSAIELSRKIKLAQIGLALSSPTHTIQQRASLQILSSMLSAGQSSILRRKLILEDEFTDRLRTVASSFREAGMFFTSFAVQPSKVSKVLKILTKTVRDLRENSAKFKENFENARSHAVGLFSTTIDTRMMWRATQGSWETLRRGHCSWDELISSLESLDFDEFKDNVAEITQPERMALVLAGNVKRGAATAVHW